jgi:hypothetical protein
MVYRVEVQKTTKHFHFSKIKTRVFLPLFQEKAYSGTIISLDFFIFRSFISLDFSLFRPFICLENFVFVLLCIDLKGIICIAKDLSTNIY